MGELDEEWTFQAWLAAGGAAYTLLHLTLLEYRLRYSRSHSSRQEIRQFEMLGRHAKKLAVLASVPLLVGAIVLLTGRTWGVAPMLIGQALGWITLTHWLGAKRVARVGRTPDSFRPRSWRRDVAWFALAVGLAGVVLYVRADDLRALLWLVPMTLLAAIALLVMREMAAYGEAPE